MKICLLLFCFSLFSFGNLSAEENNLSGSAKNDFKQILDSIKIIYEASESDAEKLKLLDELSRIPETYEKGINYASEYSIIAKRQGEAHYIARASYLLARANWLAGNYNVSIEKYLSALDLYRKIDDSLNIANCLNSIGIQYFIQGKSTTALDYFLRSKAIYQQIDDTAGLGLSLINITECYYALKDFENTQKFNKLTKQMYADTTDMGYAYCLTIDGNVFFDQGSFALALDSYEHAFRNHKSINHKHGMAENLINISKSLYKLDRLEEAAGRAQQSLDIGLELQNEEIIKNSYYELARAYAKLKDFETAYKFHRLFHAVNDSIEKNDIIATIEKYELNQTIITEKSRVALLTKENELEQTRFNYLQILTLTIVIAALIIILIFINRYRLKKRINRQLEEMNSTKDKFFSIISHDLKSPLASLVQLSGLLTENYDSIDDKHKKEYAFSIKDSGKKLFDLTENLLSWANLQTGKHRAYPDIFSLKMLVDKEIGFLRSIAADKKINIRNQVADSCSVYADQEMIGTVIRNLLHNSIKFSDKNASILVTSTTDTGKIYLSIKDFGVGIKDSDKGRLFRIDIKHSTIGTDHETGTGLGLNLCKEFIEINDGSISYDSVCGQGTVFTISMPIAE